MSATKNDKLLLAGASLPVTEALMAALHGGPVGAIVALGLSGIVYVVADEMESRGKEISLPRFPHKEKAERQPGEHSALYKMFNGKSVRGEAAGADDFDSVHLDGDAFTFSQLLATGWRPSYKEIFVARLEDGTDVFITVEQAVHIALAGSTRQGKTSIIRQLLAQLCYIGCCCILLDPHYTPYDVEIDEDWTPYTPYLRFDPLECKDFDRMEKILRHASSSMLDARKKLREASKPVGVPVFIIIDEYPAVIAERPKIQEYVNLLLRQGAKYKIFLCVASQDFHVKTVSPKEGGGIRDNYKTILYVGGDKTTANVLLDTSVDPAIEAILGKGPVMLRCEGVKKASLAQTAFTDNQALYDLLGPSTYQPSEDEIEAADAHAEMSGIDDDEKEVETETLSAAPTATIAPTAVIAPKIPTKGPKAADIDINVLCAVWNGGVNTVLGLEQLFKMSHGEAYKAYKLIMAQQKQPVEEQEQE